MKIDINRIPAEGLTLDEEISSSALDLDTDIIKFARPIKIKAEVYRITNTVTVHLSLTTSVRSNCSRCLNEFESDFKKELNLSYPVNPATAARGGVNKLESVIDLNPDIREKIILDYPIKSLCSPDCKGLCPKCGKNLNEGGCSCGIT